MYIPKMFRRNSRFNKRGEIVGDVVKYRNSLYKMLKKAMSEGIEISIHEGYISIKNDIGECCIVEINK